MCHVRYFHDSHGSPADLSGTYCSAWSNNACCTRETAEKHQLDDDHLEALYTADYSYAKCGPVSENCARWFLAESCLYECDVNVGRYRAHVGDAGCEDGGNEWMIRNMPLKLGVAHVPEIIPFEPETDNSGEGKLCLHCLVQGGFRLR